MLYITDEGEITDRRWHTLHDEYTNSAPKNDLYQCGSISMFAVQQTTCYLIPPIYKFIRLKRCFASFVLAFFMVLFASLVLRLHCKLPSIKW